MQVDMPYNATATIQVPARYRSDVGVMVIYKSIEEVERQCGRRTVACTVRVSDLPPFIIARNPCTLKYDLHARDMCHEVGHVNGWGKEHAK